MWTDTKQEGPDNVRYPVASSRRTTNNAEIKYVPTELEVAAWYITWNIFKFASKVTIYTDHQALVLSFLPYMKSQTKGILPRDSD